MLPAWAELSRFQTTGPHQEVQKQICSHHVSPGSDGCILPSGSEARLSILRAGGGWACGRHGDGALAHVGPSCMYCSPWES